MIYQTLSDESYQFVLIILMGFGGMVKLLQESGALLGFGKFVHKFATGQKKPMVISWLMALIMFIVYSSYRSCVFLLLAVGWSFRGSVPSAGQMAGIRLAA